MSDDISGAVEGFGGVFMSDSSYLEKEVERLRKGLGEVDLSLEIVELENGFFLHDTREPSYLSESVAVVFSGYLYEDLGSQTSPAEHIAEKYGEHGKEFPRYLKGEYRVAVYDRKEKRLNLLTDRPGTRNIYYRSTDSGFIFSSHLTSMLACNAVEPELNRQAVIDYLFSDTVGSFSGKSTLVEGVKQMNASELLSRDRESMNCRTYWDPLPVSKKEPPEDEVMERTEKLLREAAETLVGQHEGNPKVMFSGGMDSSVLAALVDEASESGAEVYTLGEIEERYSLGKESADLLGIPREKIPIPSQLVTSEEVWRIQLPTNWLTAFRFTQLPSQGIEHCYSGLSGTATFPVGLQRLRKLDCFTKLKPLFRTLYDLDLDRFLEVIETPYSTADKGVEILSNPHKSGVFTTLTRDSRKNINSIMCQDDDLDFLSLDRELDNRWDLEGMRLDETAAYLKFRENSGTVTKKIADPFMDHYDLFAYPPLVEYQFSLSMDRRKQRRILRKVMKDILPPELVEKLEKRGHEEADGSQPVVKEATHHIESNRREYEKLVESFLERGFLEPEPAREYLIDQPTRKKTYAQKLLSINIYVLERWIQTLIERDEPWKSP